MGEVDDARLLALLWAGDEPPGPRRGAKSQLTLRAIVAAGIAAADDRGAPELSMRRVAARLGCTPMALYSYVDGRETLLRLMYDAAHAGFAPAATADDASVEDGVLAWAVALADLYAAHHWLAELSWARPVLGPNEQQVLESLLQHLRPLALAPGQEGVVASALLTLCRATGRLVADARHVARVTGRTDEQWWQEQSAAMAALVPDFVARFPLSSRVASAARGADPGDRPSGGYVERAARIQLEKAVRLILLGAASNR